MKNLKSMLLGQARKASFEHRAAINSYKPALRHSYQSLASSGIRAGLGMLWWPAPPMGAQGNYQPTASARIVSYPIFSSQRSRQCGTHVRL